LIWGEHIHDVGIIGPGLIWGRGLSRGEVAEGGLPAADTQGAADKAIALKHCHNVTLRDVAILAGGHFGILATGVDNLVLDHLKIDTNRDGMNIDCCRNVRISGCSVNSPSDDGICLKSSFALGEARPTENVTISDCYVTGGWQIGTMLDGTPGPRTGPGSGICSLSRQWCSSPPGRPVPSTKPSCLRWSKINSTHAARSSSDWCSPPI
jgi:polygalacturonase